MKQHLDNPNVCPHCKRHCSVDDLHCSRGRVYFGQEAEEFQHNKNRKNINIKDEAVILMLKCGHLLHHGLRERAESEDILYFLSSEEKNELMLILKKCIDVWDNQ